MQHLNRIVFMKYGNHANETYVDILQSKRDEVKSFQRTFWGFSGNICHPAKQLQPFIQSNKRDKEKTFLVLSRINTSWNSSTQRASFYSYDCEGWLPIPTGNVVKGSKYALICKTFDMCCFSIDLSQYYVPIGKSEGRLLSQYIGGHITRGCGIFSQCSTVETSKNVPISAVAEVEDAVFLR